MQKYRVTVQIDAIRKDKMTDLVKYKKRNGNRKKYKKINSNKNRMKLIIK